MARLILATHPRTHDVDVLKVDVPLSATHSTAWRLTRASRLRYYVPHAVQSYVLGEPLRLPYGHDTAGAEPDSDAHAIAVGGVVSVTPLSLDLTSRVDLSDYEACLRSLAQ
ncbi:5'-nucleotidase SurE [Chloroflexota bacterium]|nr:5'-nucleotidase SurE [Chloroflexota bacterium]